MWMIWLLIGMVTASFLGIIWLLIRSHVSRDTDMLKTWLEERARVTDDLIRKINQETNEKLLTMFSNSQIYQERMFNDFKDVIQKALHQHRTEFDERQLETLKILQESLRTALLQHAEELTKRVDKLTQATDDRLKEISGQVEKRLTEGFEKTTETFTDVIKRLALIDEAQKKITELSTNVVSLQEILSDKRSRGAFGEVQLASLIRNMLPENHFSFQYTLNNGKRVDCMIFLPAPTGNVAIDAKFPLETFRRLTETASELERKAIEQQFKQDIKKHIQDVATKYIIPGETSDGAVMFIPAEAVFAEIHARFPDLVELAQHEHVWMVSPTTMMAILTTARAVLKDEATKQQVHIIRDHLNALGKDFDRFQKRMDNLASHIKQAHEDVDQVHTSAKKITTRFQRIEKVELDHTKELKLETIPPEE